MPKELLEHLPITKPMKTKTTAADLLTETHRIVSTIEPLFYTLIKVSEQAKCDTIQISTTRAKEIAADLHILKKKLQSLKDSERIAESTTDRHLDEMFGLN
jgi:hypothetical protein